MAKQKFYILVQDVRTKEVKWKEAEGERIRHNGEDFFIHTQWNPHYERETEWRVTHGKTGLAVVTGAPTKKEAKERFKTLMNNTPAEKVAQAIQQQIEKYGMSPLYSEDDKKKKTTKKKVTA